MLRSSIAATLIAIVLIIGTAQGSPFSNIEHLYSFVSVDYDWKGSPWTNKQEAITDGSFIVENNVITGINVYNGTIFVCIPRWRRGVPSTLNVVVPDPNNASAPPVLRPYPSWDANLNWLSYVQSIFIDHHKGLMYIIDAGRQNFFSANASDLVNRPAALYVWDINNEKVVYEHTFSDSIFPYNSSFLNDIVVDEKRNVAYMSDTNVAGLGAIVFHDLNTRRSFRFQDPSCLAELWYRTTILGITYPIQNPADGIALSSDGSTVFYSSVDGIHMFSLDATVMRAPNATFSSVHNTVQNLTQKVSFSDGLRYLPLSSSRGGDIILYGSIGDTAVRYAKRNNASEPFSHHLILREPETMQWLDTFAFVPSLTKPEGYVYYTTNRLQLYFFHTMDFSGGSGANFRIWRMKWNEDD